MMKRLSSIKLVLLIGTIYSRISLEQMKTAIENVLGPKKLEHTIINPLFGHMFRANGCLESIRFFSSELEIKYEDTGERIYKEDKGKDSLTNLLIQLFPSHTGVLNTFRGIDLDFTNKYFIKNIAYYNKKKNDRKVNIEMLGKTFASLLNKHDIKKIRKVSENTKHIYKLFEYYVLLPSTVPGLDKEIQKLLITHVYAVEIFDRPDELEIYLKSIFENLEDTKNVIHLELSDEQKQLFKVLYDNPSEFPYSRIYQPVPNSSIPIYDRKIDKSIPSKRFPDCVDITILHLCNCLFYNDDLVGRCSLDHLNLEDPPKETHRLKKFYEDYHHKPFKVTQEMRNDWSRVVQGLADNKAFECQNKYKPYMIHYIKEEYRNEIRSGLFNTMSVLANICDVNDEYKEIMTKGRISKDSVVEKLTEFFNQICNRNLKVTIAGEDIEEIARNNVSDFKGDFIITFDFKKSNLSVIMKLCISQNHTSFFFEGTKSEVKRVDLIVPKNLKSNDNSFLLSLLINRYTMILNDNDKNTENFDYPFEVLYNQGALHSNEQKRDQCIHLCEFICKNKTFDHRITKRIIKNIVKSANLSDPAIRIIFLAFLIYTDDIFEQMSNYEVVEGWMISFSKNSIIRPQNIRNAWSEAVRKSSMKIRSIAFSSNYASSIDSVKTILSAIKDTLEDLKLIALNLNPEKFICMIQKFLAGNKVIQALAIPQNELSPTNILEILDLLKDIKSLKTLDLSGNKMFNAEDAKRLACALKNNASLTKLNVRDIFLENAGFEFIVNILANNETLTTLDISGNNIGSKDIKMIAAVLKKNTTLTTLIISDSNLDAKAAKQIVAALKRNRTLTTLDISNNMSIGSEGIKGIVNAFKRNNKLTTLNISRTCCDRNKNNFGKQIAYLLRSKSKLTVLDISYNKLEAEDAEQIAKPLRRNTTLTELDISNNDIQDQGTKYIASIFIEKKDLERLGMPSFSGRENKTLTKLNISSNKIKSKGLKYLMDVIEKSESLACLDISYNSIKDESINHITDALAKNKFLKVLNIASSDISAGDSKKILEALKENRSLVELGLAYFGTQNEMAEYIADALQGNNTLKTLDIMLPQNVFYGQRNSLCNAIERNTTLEKIIFRRARDVCFLISDRMPIENNSDRHTNSKSSEFRRIEMYLAWPERTFE